MSPNPNSPQTAPGAPQATVNAPVPSNPNTLMRPVALIERLERSPRYDGKKVIDYIRDLTTPVPGPVAVEFIKVINELEGQSATPQFRENLVLLQSYYERMSPRTTEEIAQEGNPELELIFTRLRTQVAEVAVHTEGTSVMPVGSLTSYLVDDLGGTALNYSAEGLRRLNSASPVVQAAAAAALIFGLYKLSTKDWAKDLVKTVAGFGVGYVLINAITGRSPIEWTDRGIDAVWNRNRNAMYANYFNLDYSDQAAKKRVDLLVESFVEPNAFGSRPFAEIINARNTSTNNRMPDSFVSNVRFNSLSSNDDKAAIMYHSVTMINSKFGPGSRLYEGNSIIKDYWDQLATGTIEWREGVLGLLRLDPDPVQAELGRIERTSNFLTQSASGVLSFSRDAFNAVTERLQTPYNYVKTGITDAFNRVMLNSDNGVLNNWLAKTITNESQLAAIEGSVGGFAYRALNSQDPSNLYREPAGVVYGGYKITLSEQDIADSSKRMQLVNEYAEKFYTDMRRTYDERFDNNFSGRLDILYGAELRRPANGGDYYLSFSYTPNNLQFDDNPVINTQSYQALNRLAGNETDFRLNRYEMLRAKEFFQAEDTVQLRSILRRIRSNHVPAGTNPRDMVISGELFTARLRTDVLTGFTGVNFDPDSAARLDALEAINTRLAAGNMQKLNAANALLYSVAAGLPVRPNFTSRYGSSNFATEYEQYLTANINSL